MPRPHVMKRRQRCSSGRKHGRGLRPRLRRWRQKVATSRARWWLLALGFWMLTTGTQQPTAKSHQPCPGHRLVIGAGTILLVPDSTTGLTIWATRETRPGRNPSPDFVGWLDP